MGRISAPAPLFYPSQESNWFVPNLLSSLPWQGRVGTGPWWGSLGGKAGSGGQGQVTGSKGWVWVLQQPDSILWGGGCAPSSS